MRLIERLKSKTPSDKISQLVAFLAFLLLLTLGLVILVLRMQGQQGG